MIKTIVLSFIAVLALVLLESFRERRSLRAEHYRFPVRQGKGMRLLFLSDLHGCRFGKENRRLAEAAAALSPDAILLGGDMLKASGREKEAPDTKELLSLLERFRAICPVYYAPGNHESRYRRCWPEAFEAFRQGLSRIGVRYLENACSPFRKNGTEVLIYGAELPKEYYLHLPPGIGRKHPMPADFLPETLGTISPSEYSILLLHTPLYPAEAAAWGADLVLSGHMHGGTVRFPDGTGLMTPQRQFLEKKCSGLHRYGKTLLLVNRGLGTHSVNLRLNDLPEISVIDLSGPEEE